nr:hypothetical protein [Prochlorococcus marinus]
MNKKIAVVYLCRYSKDYLNHLNKFLKSITLFKSGIPYSLNIIFKNHKEIPIELKKICNKYKANLRFFPDDGFDWGAYIRFAKEDNSEYLLFLNSYSEIHGYDWLKNLVKPLLDKRAIITGATGSFASKRFMILPLKFIYISPLTFIKFLIFYLLDLIFLNSFYYPFPSVHIRSNAFMLRRKDFLEYTNTQKFPKTKEDVLRLENGKFSLTRYFLKRKFSVGIVGKNGKFYLPNEWKGSKIYKNSRQENLLISDNQTNLFLLKIVNEKKRLIEEFIAWGLE